MSRYAVAATATLGFLISSAEASFQAHAKDNVAVYWAQGSNQARLLETCKNPDVDVVVIGYVNVSPDQAGDEEPRTYFGNACETTTYENKLNIQTPTGASCSDVGADITVCQKTYGKKIMLSLGGGYPTKYFIGSDHGAVSFANFLWGAFGPVTDNWIADKGPRPFGSAVVDGFDFDIESEISTAATFKGKPINSYKVRGYVKMIETLKQTLYPTDTTKDYFISGSPQCMIPDEHFAQAVQSAWFDWLFIQYHNTPICAAREGLNYIEGANSVATSFNKWTQVPFFNKKASIYLGLSGSSRTPDASDYYLAPLEADLLIKQYVSDAKLGGVMLWEASSALVDVTCDKSYPTWMKQLLVAAQTNSYIDTSTTDCKPDSEVLRSRMIKRQVVEDPTLPQSSTTSSILTSAVVTTSSAATVTSEVQSVSTTSTIPESSSSSVPPVNADLSSTTSTTAVDAGQSSSTTTLLTTPDQASLTSSEATTTEEPTSAISATVPDAVLPVTTVTAPAENLAQPVPTSDTVVDSASVTQLPTTTSEQVLPDSPTETQGFRTVTVTSTIIYTITADGAVSTITTVVPLTTTLDVAAASITPGPPTRTVVLTSTLTSTITVAADGADETITSYATQFHTIALAMNPDTSLYSPHTEEENITRTTRITRTETISLTVTVAARSTHTGSTTTVAEWVTLTRFAEYIPGTGLPRASSVVVNRVYSMTNATTGVLATGNAVGGSANRLASTATGTAPIVLPTGGGAKLSTKEGLTGGLAAVVVCVALLLA